MKSTVRHSSNRSFVITARGRYRTPHSTRLPVLHDQQLEQVLQTVLAQLVRLSSPRFCGGSFIWLWRSRVGVGRRRWSLRPRLCVVGVLVLDGGEHPDGGVRPSGVVPVDPLGGGDFDIVNVRPGPLLRMSSDLYSEFRACARALSQESPLEPTEATAWQPARACPWRMERYCTPRSQ